MPKEEWGVKRACPKCSTRFYDLHKDPMACPSCGNIFTLASLMDSLRGRATAKAKAEAEPTAAKADIDDVELIDDDADIESDDDLLEEEDDDTVSLDEIADVATDDDE